MDINKASAEELERAFEVDGERARYIVDKRNELGAFASWQQVEEVVPSIDHRMVENLRAAGLTIGRKAEGDKGSENEQQSSSTKLAHSGVPSSSSEIIPKNKDLNAASREELKHICQIDGERAEYFLQKRRELGGFETWEEIKDNVPSFDGQMIKRLKNAGYRLASKRSDAA